MIYDFTYLKSIEKYFYTHYQLNYLVFEYIYSSSLEAHSQKVL